MASTLSINKKITDDSSKHKPKKKTKRKTHKKHKISRRVKKNDLAQVKVKAQSEKQKKETTPYELRYEVTKEKLGFLGNVISEGELQKMVDMDTAVPNIAKRLKQRIILVSIIVLLGLVMAVLMGKNGTYFAMGSPVLAGLVWFMEIRKTNAFYRNWQLERQLAFAQFTRLAAAYLPEMSQGANLYSIFKKLIPRMRNTEDRTALQGLMINMQVDPEDPKPFTDFAHKFTASSDAELIMLTIQQMYLGDVSDKNIRVLADDANKDMIRQIDTVISAKIKKFYQITTRIAMLSMIVVFGFLMCLLFQEFSTAFTMMGQASSNSAKALNDHK